MKITRQLRIVLLGLLVMSGALFSPQANSRPGSGALAGSVAEMNFPTEGFVFYLSRLTPRLTGI